MKWFTILLICFITFNAFGNEAEHHTNNHLAIFTGATTNFEHESTDFSLGADYEYRLPIWHGLTGIGLFGEAVFAEHTELIGGLPIFVHPYKGFKMLIAPGVISYEAVVENVEPTSFGKFKKEKIQSETSEETEKHTEFLLRFGLAYDFHAGMFSFTPTINADLVNGHWALVYGIGFGIGF